MLKKFLYFFLLTFLYLPSSFALKQKAKEELGSYAFKERYIMAVMPFEDKTKDKKYDYLEDQIADQMINEIFPSKRYRLIEREKLSALLQEMQIQQTEYFNNKTIDQLGSQLGAELMLVGSIVDISEHTDKQSLGLIKKQKTTLTISLEARIVLIKTGEILAISKWSGQEKTSKKQALMATTGDDRSTEDLIASAIKKAVTEMAYHIAKDAPKKDSSQ